LSIRTLLIFTQINVNVTLEAVTYPPTILF
jgi:hypothetical protein